MRTAEELRYLVLAAELEGKRQLAHQLRPFGLTPSQAEVLRVLADHGPLSLNGLGSLLVCESGSNPSRLIDRIVARGLVDSRSDLGASCASVSARTPLLPSRSPGGGERSLDAPIRDHPDHID